MGLKLNATSGGSVELDVSDTASDFALTVPAAAGVIDRLERVGNVLQVVHFQNTAGVSLSQAFASAAWTDTELTLQITPIGTNSRIVVITNQQGQNSTGNGGCNFRLLRNGTAVGAFGATGYLAHFNSTGNMLSTDTMVDIDDTANLSGTLTYKTQFIVANGGTAFTRGHTMTLVEVAR